MGTGKKIVGTGNYVTIKEVITINGSGIVIAIIGMAVVTLFDMPDEKARIFLRWLGFILSFGASYVIYINTNFGLAKEPAPHKINAFVLWFVNGCFIYLSACGVNYLNNSKKEATDKTRTTASSVIPFLKDVSWWPDANILEENEHLKGEVKRLTNEINQDRQQVDVTPRDSSQWLQVSLAEQHEKAGFQALLDKDPDKAIASFNASEQSLNGYHMVYEIRRYLIKHRQELINAPDSKWTDFYQLLLNQYSYDMSADIKNSLKSRLQ